MSIVSISYSSLGKASGEANDVAKKLDTYADSLYNNVYKKLNKYDGSYTDNVRSARSNTNAKINSLRNRANDYRSYASDLTELKNECDRVDVTVKNKVSTLTATFKENYGIRDSKVENAINYFFTWVGNSTGAGRWIGDKKDELKAKTDHIKESIEDWYDYGGGKEFLTGSLVAILEGGIALVSLALAALAFFSGGSLFVFIAAVVGAIIAFADANVNIKNEQDAYNARQNGDPAMGYRRSKLDSLTDTMRADSDNKVVHIIAGTIDVVAFVCEVIDFVDSCGELMKNGFKWATGSTADLEDIKFKDIFTKDAGLKFKDKILSSFGDLSQSLKKFDFNKLPKVLNQFGNDFMTNLNNKYGKADSPLNLMKNMFKIEKNFIKDGVTFKNIFSGFIFPGITVFSVSSVGKNVDNVVLSEFTDIAKDIFIDFPETIGKISKNFNDMMVIDKLASLTDINIEVPTISLPDISIPIVRTV